MRIIKKGLIPLKSLISSVGMDQTVVPVRVKLKCVIRQEQQGDRPRMSFTYQIEHEDETYDLDDTLGFTPCDLDNSEDTIEEITGKPYLDDENKIVNPDYKVESWVMMDAYEIHNW